MLTWLHVKNLALIEEEEIDFGEGLNILTGETGAGKSILLGSIALALGGRADADLVRQGADYCLVELAFRVDSEEQKKALDERGIRPEEDDTLLLRRRIYADKAAGRSSASVGGESVTLKELQEISDLFVEVSGQQENQRLLRREEQRDILDTYAGEEAKSLLSEVADAYEKYRTLERAAAETDLDEERAGREAELLAYEISELEQAGLVPGEDKTLEERHETLRHFEKITAALEEAQAALSEDGVTDRLGRAAREVSRAMAYAPDLEGIAAQLSDIDALLGDAARALSEYQNTLVFDPEEFAGIGARLDELNRLKEKYRPRDVALAGASIEDLLETLEEKRKRKAFLEDLGAARDRRAEELAAAKEALQKHCDALTDLRRRTGAQFSADMEKALSDLHFKHVAFGVEVEADAAWLSAAGWDQVTFQVSLNEGEPLRPLHKVASGGEQSRILLALKTLPNVTAKDRVFVFDEIDSGISGRTAWGVAERMGTLARNHQLLCITHLPQIAAMQDRHFVIEKEEEGGRTKTHIRRLSEEESLRELARLLGGEHLSEAALSNAAQMRAEAQKAKQDALVSLE